jgi:hypothetical protein
MSTTTDSKQKLILLLNDTFNPPKIFSDQRISFGAPQAVDGQDTYDTEVQANAIPGMGYYGSALVRYTRVDLSVHPVLQLSSLDQFTLDAICTQFNGLNGSWLTANDLLPPTIPTVAQDESAPLVLEAAPNSLGYKGTITVTLQHAAPQLASYVHNRVLMAQLGLSFDDYGHATGRDWYWNIDFTSMRDALVLKPVYQTFRSAQGTYQAQIYTTITDVQAIYTVLRKLGYPVFGAPGIRYAKGYSYYQSASDQPTSAVADSNKNFDRVVIIGEGDGANPRSPVYLHYNILENR